MQHITFQACSTPSVPLGFQCQYISTRTAVLEAHVQLERACCSFKTSPPPAIATSLAMTTGKEIHKYGHVVEQVGYCKCFYSNIMMTKNEKINYQKCHFGNSIFVIQSSLSAEICRGLKNEIRCTHARTN